MDDNLLFDTNHFPLLGKVTQAKNTMPNFVMLDLAAALVH